MSICGRSPMIIWGGSGGLFAQKSRNYEKVRRVQSEKASKMKGNAS